MIPQHLGALHPVEQIATIVLAFGPFVVLGIVIAIRRRAEVADERRLAEHQAEHDSSGDAP
ncbi:hypothetical protein ASE01_16510 [Nocardioides sp. Root190]|uniref:hypothetical protein n=1 Tax=Nocardioides sp. Root190 TaxID=1736488 RepID=UPI0006F6A1F3|nr:hypothetical protein [Nocardioides sp. Root190]KRB74974.1 hypothetical protein ASE01_16510 [Nocardioides sp. Root190]